jgi:hypothetical protein
MTVKLTADSYYEIEAISKIEKWFEFKDGAES